MDRKRRILALIRAFQMKRAAQRVDVESRELNKPFRTPGGPKKFGVVVMDGARRKLVRFGDPNMTIKKSNPERRRSFRARHGCDNPGPNTSARYWSCKKW